LPALEGNYKAVRDRIKEAANRSGRDPREVKIIAVSKNVSPESILAAKKLGLNDFGENRLQEALPKITALPADIKWHFVGHLQTNKVRDVLDRFSMVHSLDRMSLAQALEKESRKKDTVMPVLVQINASGEASKYGLAPEELEDFLEEVKDFSGIKVRGLMTMAPLVDNPEETRPVFARLRNLKEQINIPSLKLDYLSMGMTNDYQIAVEEGANLVRIGTAIFG